MQVEFSKRADGQCLWVARRTRRRTVPGAVMGGFVRAGDLPHDLAQLVAEAALRLPHGFWGLVDAGATFRSTGRRRTRPGRQVIADHRGELVSAEHAVNVHVEAWRAGAPTEVATALDAMAARWAALPVGGTVVVEWPSGVVLPVASA